MKFTFAHNNLNVYDLDKSLAFYKEALGLTVTRTKDADDGSFKLVYLGDGSTPHLLELTWLRDMDRPYNLGDNEIHLAFTTDDFEKAYAFHKEKGVVCYENTAMGDLLRDARTAPVMKSVLQHFGSALGMNGGGENAAITEEAGLQMLDAMPLRAMASFGGAQAAAALPGLLAALRAALPEAQNKE